jgi:DNA-binding transcriptional MerR regulator
MSQSERETANLTIGVLASHTKTNVPTIRYYEEIDLLPRAQRAANGHRFYREADLKRLIFIKRCRDFGFPIEQVRELVALFEDGDRACIEVRDLAQVHLNSVREKLKELRQLETSLAAFVTSCDEACCAGPTRDCVIIEDLSLIEASPTSTAPAGCCAPSSAAQKVNFKPPKASKSMQGKRK